MSVDFATVIISGLSFVASIVAIGVARKATSTTLEESRKTAARALWYGLQEAVQRLFGFDPNTEPIDERLNNLRIACIAFVDESNEWAGLEGWLNAERHLGAALALEVMEGERQGDSVEQRFENLFPYLRWARLLSDNLRSFRRVGFDPTMAAELQAATEMQAKAIYEKHGWDLPPTSIPGVTQIRPHPQKERTA